MVPLAPFAPFAPFPLPSPAPGGPITLARLALAGRPLLLGLTFFPGHRRRFGRLDRFGPGRALG